MPAFQLGFLALAIQIPGIVGRPVEDEHFDTASQCSLQRTTTGLMVWRKIDNWTAFTDGYQTWVNGPYGIQKRLNSERFQWEKDPIIAPDKPAVKFLHHWLSPSQDAPPQTIADACARAKSATPAGFQPGLVVPTVYATWYQAECRNSLGRPLKPASPAEVAGLMVTIAGQGIDAAGWAIPRFLTEDEGRIQGTAAAGCNLFILDVEPYSGFVKDPSVDPTAYMRGFDSACPRRPWISLAPMPSGIDGLAGHVDAWLHWGVGVRPQAYWTDGPALGWPDPASIYLAGIMAKAGVTLPVVAMFPHRAVDPTGVDAHLSAATGNTDIWVLGA